MQMRQEGVTGNWWLRSPNHCSSDIMYGVGCGGWAGTDFSVHEPFWGVVPALVIDLTLGNFTSTLR